MKTCLFIVVVIRINDLITTITKTIATTTILMLNDNDINITYKKNRVDDTNNDFENILKKYSRFIN